MEKLLTVKEVTKILKVHWQTVLEYIRQGKLIAVRMGRGYRIDERDLQTFINERKTKKI